MLLPWLLTFSRQLRGQLTSGVVQKFLFECLILLCEQHPQEHDKSRVQMQLCGQHSPRVDTAAVI